jgi:hypothetical protein
VDVESFNNNNNKDAYAGATDSLTHIRVLLSLTDCGILAQTNPVIWAVFLAFCASLKMNLYNENTRIWLLIDKK